jgi:hypothetical protein
LTGAGVVEPVHAERPPPAPDDAVRDDPLEADCGRRLGADGAGQLVVEEQAGMTV